MLTACGLALLALVALICFTKQGGMGMTVLDEVRGTPFLHLLHRRTCLIRDHIIRGPSQRHSPVPFNPLFSPLPLQKRSPAPFHLPPPISNSLRFLVGICGRLVAHSLSGLASLSHLTEGKVHGPQCERQEGHQEGGEEARGEPQPTPLPPFIPSLPIAERLAGGVTPSRVFGSVTAMAMPYRRTRSRRSRTRPPSWKRLWRRRRRRSRTR